MEEFLPTTCMTRISNNKKKRVKTKKPNSVTWKLNSVVIPHVSPISNNLMHPLAQIKFALEESFAFLQKRDD